MLKQHRNFAPLAAPLLVQALLLGACSGDPGGPVDPYAAPDFTLQDLNPGSPTYLDDISLGDATDMVVVMYFASYT